MAKKTVIVGSSVGLHARPAATVAAAAGEYDDEITLSLAGGDPIDASSVLPIMTLGAEHGSEITVESDTPRPSTRSPPSSRRTSTPDPSGRLGGHCFRATTPATKTPRSLPTFVTRPAASVR